MKIVKATKELYNYIKIKGKEQGWGYTLFGWWCLLSGFYTIAKILWALIF